VSRGRFSGAAATITRAIQRALTRPSMAPAAHSTNVSASHNRAIAAGEAPSANRTACSRRRTAARVSIRPDTLAQPISSRTATAPDRSERIVEKRRDDRRGRKSLRAALALDARGDLVELGPGGVRADAGPKPPD